MRRTQLRTNKNKQEANIILKKQATTDWWLYIASRERAASVRWQWYSLAVLVVWTVARRPVLLKGYAWLQWLAGSKQAVNSIITIRILSVVTHMCSRGINVRGKIDFIERARVSVREEKDADHTQISVWQKQDKKQLKTEVMLPTKKWKYAHTTKVANQIQSHKWAYQNNKWVTLSPMT